MQIENNVSLFPYNTFRIDQKAHALVRFSAAHDLVQWIRDGRLSEKPTLILGGGSNILLRGDVAGVVLKNEIGGIEKVGEDDQFVFLKAGAGVNWHQFVLYAIENGWGGVENLSLIPGTVGAAPMQNIGAYGVEIKDVFHSLEAVDMENGVVETFDATACKFGYRESVFKSELRGKYAIVSVTFRLTKQHHYNIGYGAIQETLAAMNATPTLRSISEAVISIRSSKLPDPAVIGNAGSFFKNPTIPKQQFLKLIGKYPSMPHYETGADHEKIPAAWLIEQCGWKGFRQGDIGVHEKQALVLVNYGNGKGEELFKLSLGIQASVFEKFGIMLSPEVNLV